MAPVVHTQVFQNYKLPKKPTYRLKITKLHYNTGICTNYQYQLYGNNKLNCIVLYFDCSHTINKNTVAANTMPQFDWLLYNKTIKHVMIWSTDLWLKHSYSLR